MVIRRVGGAVAAARKDYFLTPYPSQSPYRVHASEEEIEPARRSSRRRRAGKTGLGGAATREDRAFDDAGDATLLRLLEERFGSPGQPCFDRGLVPLPSRGHQER